LDTSHPQHHHASGTHSTSLLLLNDRLTRQLEDNLVLFEHLNQELKNTSASGEVMRAVVEERRLREASNAEEGRYRHRKEMEKMKKRQEEYMRKIQRI
jgi:hypothetical protein